MFNFLKEKLKSWIGKAKKKIEKKAEVVELTEEKEIKKKEKPKKVEKLEKKKRTKEELKEERQVTEQVMADLKKEELEIKTPEEKFEEAIKEKEEKRKEELREEEEKRKEELREEEKEKGKEEIKEREAEEEKREEKKGFFEKLKKIFTAYTITEQDFQEMFSDLEMSLLENNVALEVVESIKENLKKQLVGKEIKKGNAEAEITRALKESLEQILINPENIIENIKEYKKITQEPYKILFFGINGVGKTTSIAKICHLLQKNKLSCVLAAADTFRAASIEQLQIHADKLKVKLIRQDYGSDPSAVAFDAIKYAQQHKIDVVLIDTAGRMHTKENLLREMEKICRVTKPNLKVFVAEAIAGNDAIEQARNFNEAVQIDGSILAKTDVDEKGGTIISISYITKKSILYLGTGQSYQDLELFDKEKFIKQLGL